MKKKIAFLNGNRIVYYSLKGEALDEAIDLVIEGLDDEPAEGELTDDANPMESYNATALCYIGIINAEFAILNYANCKLNYITGKEF